MLDFYLSINNSEEVIHIPVTPSEFTVSSSQGSKTGVSVNFRYGLSLRLRVSAM